MTEYTTDDRDRQRRYDELAKEIRGCHLCPGMNRRGETQAAPGRGCLRSPVVIVGQSLCTKCMESQILFDGGSGLLLDDALGRIGRTKDDVFITNAVHCHPPKNRKSLAREKEKCRPYLIRELAIVRPRGW
jgi:uracil-DNA glycosylase